MKWLSFLFGKWVYKPWSLLIKTVLLLRGVKVGKKFYTEGIPLLKINGKAGNIAIGSGVSILGNIDLRNRENGKIIIHDNAKIENDCRIVSAREGTIEIGENSVLGAFSILNGGADIKIGAWCAISTFVSINANEHEMAKHEYIRKQDFSRESVIVEDDCLIGAKACLNKGVRLRRGSVIGSNAVVTKDTREYGIYAGVPAKQIGIRK